MPVLPSGPLRLLTQLKYASMPRGIGAYREAGPLSGNVPPIVIDVFVTPVVAEPLRASTRAKAPGMHTASAVRIAASATSALFTKSPSFRKCPSPPLSTPPQVPLFAQAEPGSRAARHGRDDRAGEPPEQPGRPARHQVHDQQQLDAEDDRRRLLGEADVQ